MVRRFLLLSLLVLSLGCGGGGDSGTDEIPGDLTPNYASRVSLSAWFTRPVTVGFSTTGTYTEQRRNLAIANFRKWTDATNGFANFTVVPLSQNPKIVVFFKPLAEGNDPNVLGVTTITVRDGVENVRATIDISTELTQREFEATCAHEWGHAYGITEGHSDSRNDLMFAGLTDVNDPTERDANTLLLAYRDIPRSPTRTGGERTYRIITRAGECEAVGSQR
jgi:hypothetical protein